jgi:hypothetical protein
MQPTTNTPAQLAALALRRRALTGIVAAGLQGNTSNLRFWQGITAAADDIISGRADQLAAIDAAAALANERQTRLKAAVAALPVSAKNLSMAEVQQILAAQGVELSPDLVANGNLGAGEVLENDIPAVVVDAHNKHAAARVDMGHSAGQHCGLLCSGKRHDTTPTIGTHLPAQGGTLGAIIARPDGTTYGLIVADARHEVRGQWGEYPQDVPGAKGHSGASNTAAMLAAGSTIAQAVCALHIDGHADWYIPSRLEMLALYEASPALFDKDGWYWSSSQYSRYTAWCQVFEYGNSTAYDKGNEFRARPVRSIQLQPFNTSALPTQDIAEGDPREILTPEVAA